MGAWITRELDTIRGATLSPAVGVAVIATGFFGFLISLSYLSLFKLVTTTSIMVAQNVNKVLTVVLGTLVFEDQLSLLSIVGIAISIAGAAWFAQENTKKDTPAAVPVAKSHTEAGDGAEDNVK